MFENEAEEYAKDCEKEFYTSYGACLYSFKDGAEFGYYKANEEMKDIIKKLLHKLIMASVPYKTDLTEEEIAEIVKFMPKEELDV